MIELTCSTWAQGSLLALKLTSLITIRLIIEFLKQLFALIIFDWLLAIFQEFLPVTTTVSAAWGWLKTVWPYAQAVGILSWKSGIEADVSPQKQTKNFSMMKSFFCPSHLTLTEFDFTLIAALRQTNTKGRENHVLNDSYLLWFYYEWQTV